MSSSKVTPFFAAKGPEASHLRRRKFELLRKYRFPEDLFLGSLSLTFRRCGKPECACADPEDEDDLHALWILSLSLDGVRITESIPEEEVEEIRALLARGRELHDALRELATVNGKLFRLGRKEKRRTKKKLSLRKKT